MMSAPGRRVPCLLLLLCTLAAGLSDDTRSKQAYVSLLYGDSYVLPVRVMMRSLLVNSADVAHGLRDRVVMVTGKTSDRAKRQLTRDGVRVMDVPHMESPYAKDAKFRNRFLSVMAKLYIFNMTEYQRVVYIDADSLVLNDLSGLFTCGSFCAVFINPCHFNSGLMQVKPNRTLFADMVEKLPQLPSYDGGDQGFLNSYFPQFLNAPMFDPTTASPGDGANLGFARLPFSWHVDHSAYFPTFSFEFEKTDRCGPKRVVEWLGPPAAKPWVWWNYCVLDLSWLWYSYRMQLQDPYPPGIGDRVTGLVLIALTYVGLALLVRSFRQGTPSSRVFSRALPRLCPFKDVPRRMSCYYPVLGGIVLWAMSVGLSVMAVPEVLPPYFATAVFVHVRIFLTLLMLLIVGCVFCLGQRRPHRGRGMPMANSMPLWNGFRKTLGWALFESLYLVVLSGIVWKVSFATMWSKTIFISSVVATEFVLVAVMLANVSLTWLRVAESLDDIATYHR